MKQINDLAQSVQLGLQQELEKIIAEEADKAADAVRSRIKGEFANFSARPVETSAGEHRVVVTLKNLDKG